MQKHKKIFRTAMVCLLTMTMLTGCKQGGRTTEVEKVELPPLAAEHASGLQELQTAWESRTSDSGTILRLYYDDTHSMLGFVKGNNGSNRFVYLLDVAIDEAFNMVNAPENGVEKVEAYTLVDANPEDGVNQELSWQQVDMTGTLRNFFMVDSFYTGDHPNHREGTLNHTFADGSQGQLGPLSRLFQDGATPFANDGLTVLVSDLQEQGFDLNTLSSGILNYCEQVPSAKVCIVAATSAFAGQLSVPVYSMSNTGTSIASIDNYAGDVPFYYIIAGPANLVDTYCAQIQKAMGDDSSNILFTSFSSAEASCGQPLEFTLAPNTMVGVGLSDLDKGSAPADGEQSAADSRQEAEEQPASSSSSNRRGSRTSAANDGIQVVNLRTTVYARGDRGETSLVSRNIDKVWGSANIGDLMPVPDHTNIFTANVGGIGVNEKCSAFGNYAQFAAYADLPSDLLAACGANGAAPADNTYWIDPQQIELYEYNGDSWVLADANALGCIDLRFETVDGPMKEYATGQSLLAENRHVAYLRITVDGTTVSQGGLFKDQGTYYLSVPVHTSLNASMVNNAESLEAMSANIAEHRSALEGLAKSGQNYNWTSSSDEARAAAAAQFCKTPKLDELVKSLSNHFRSSSTVSEVQYVDLLFNTKAAEGRR